MGKSDTHVPYLYLQTGIWWEHGVQNKKMQSFWNPAEI